MVERYLGNRVEGEIIKTRYSAGEDAGVMVEIIIHVDDDSLKSYFLTGNKLEV